MRQRANIIKIFDLNFMYGYPEMIQFLKCIWIKSLNVVGFCSGEP